MRLRNVGFYSVALKYWDFDYKIQLLLSTIKTNIGFDYKTQLLVIGYKTQFLADYKTQHLLYKSIVVFYTKKSWVL